jgi:hypothetical protein
MLLLDSVVYLIFIGGNREFVEMRNAYEFLVGKHERKRPYRDLGVGRRIILRLILKKCELYSAGSGQSPVANFC